jgi:hypothetical protein
MRRQEQLVPETWTVDGYTITSSPTRDVEVRDGLYRTAGKRGADIERHADHGSTWTRKTLGPGGFTMQMWLGADTRTALEDAYDELARLLIGRPQVLQTWTRQGADGVVREAKGYVVEALEPKALGQLGMRLSFAVEIPDGSWYAQADTDTGAMALTNGATLTMATLGDATAPMDRMRYVITGQVADLTLTNEAGDQLIVPGSVASGATLTLDADTFGYTLATPGTSTVTEGGIRYTGGRFMELLPRAAGPQLVVGLSGVSGGQLRVVGRKRWLA